MSKMVKKIFLNILLQKPKLITQLIFYNNFINEFLIFENISILKNKIDYINYFC